MDEVRKLLHGLLAGVESLGKLLPTDDAHGRGLLDHAFRHTGGLDATKRELYAGIGFVETEMAAEAETDPEDPYGLKGLTHVARQVELPALEEFLNALDAHGFDVEDCFTLYGEGGEDGQVRSVFFVRAILDAGPERA